MADESTGKITVYRGSASTGKYVWSPFVTKLEARLRFSNVPYRLGGGSPRSAPGGKIPYVVTESEEGETRSIGDSTLIIRSFVEDGVLNDANKPLRPAQRAHDLAIRAMMEDKVYFYGTREKWCDNYYEMRTNMLAAIPWPLQVFAGWMARRTVISTLYGQGAGRFTEDEVLMLKEEVWDSVNALLTESVKTSSRDDVDEAPYWILGGKEPSEADATVYGFIVGGLICTA